MIAQVLDERRLPSRSAATSRSPTAATRRPARRSGRTPSRRSGSGPRRAVAIGHNGNLVNTRELLEQLPGGRARLPASTDTELLTALLADEPAPTRSRRSLQRAAARPRRLLARGPRRATGHRRPRPVRLPAARPRAACRSPTRSRRRGPGLWADDDARPAGSSRRRPPALDIVGAEYVRDVEPGEIVVLEPGRAPRSVRFARGDARAVRVRADLLRPARLVHGGPQPVRGAPPDGRAARRASTRPTPTWSCPCPDTGAPAAAGYAEASRHPVPRGHGPQPLRRPDVHPAVADDAPARRDDQAQPAARGRPRQAADRRRRLDRARHDDQADRRAAAQGRRRRGPRPDQRAADLPPVLLRHRHADRDRADRRDAQSVEEIREFIGADSLGYLSIARRARRARPAVRAVLLRLLRRQLPGAGPVRRGQPQVHARGRPLVVAGG